MPVAFVTGVTGQDGSYLAEQLTATGWQVHGTVRPGERIPGYVADLGDAVLLHELDLRDIRRLRTLLLASRATEVYNLAGVSSVAESWNEPVLTAEVNGVAVAALLQGVRELQDQLGTTVRFLQASSAELFAGSATAPQDESTAIFPRSPYGAAKAFGHHLVNVFRGTGLHVASVILYNHESPRRPDSFVTKKIAKTVAAIADGATAELALGNLEPRRDWGWAPEYVDAMVRAVRHDVADDYVIATGVGHSVADFVDAAFAHVGIHDWSHLVRTDAAFVRAVDPVDLVGDASKARACLGWQARAGLAEIVGRMIDAERLGPG